MMRANYYFVSWYCLMDVSIVSGTEQWSYSQLTLISDTDLIPHSWKKIHNPFCTLEFCSLHIRSTGPNAKRLRIILLQASTRDFCMQFPQMNSPSRDSHFFFSAYVAQSVSGASHSPYLIHSLVSLHLIIPAYFFGPLWFFWSCVMETEKI